jgi:hypothetical protein
MQNQLMDTRLKVNNITFKVMPCFTSKLRLNTKSNINFKLQSCIRIKSNIHISYTHCRLAMGEVNNIENAITSSGTTTYLNTILPTPAKLYQGENMTIEIVINNDQYSNNRHVKVEEPDQQPSV